MEGESVLCLALNVGLGIPLVILNFIVVSLVISRRRLKRQVIRLQRILHVRRVHKTETSTNTAITRNINATASPHTANTNNYISSTAVLDRLDNNCDDDYIITMSECSDAEDTLVYENVADNEEAATSAYANNIASHIAEAFDYSIYDDLKSTTTHATLSKDHSLLTKQVAPSTNISIQQLNMSKPSASLSTHSTSISTHVTCITTNTTNTPTCITNETTPTVVHSIRDGHVGSDTTYNCLHHTDDSEHVYGQFDETD